MNEHDEQNFCFKLSLFHASTCFEHMSSKHIEAWNKLTVKEKCCASSWIFTEINTPSVIAVHVQHNPEWTVATYDYKSIN